MGSSSEGEGPALAGVITCVEFDFKGWFGQGEISLSWLGRGIGTLRIPHDFWHRLAQAFGICWY